MTRRKTEAVTPPQVVEKLLRCAGEDVVLVGGQALGFWVQRYELVMPADFTSISADTDFLTRSAADRGTVERLAAAIQGATFFPNERALTALVGQAYFDISDDEFINVDVVFDLIGLEPDDVRAHAVRATLGSGTFLVMHPLDVLRSRLANLYKLAEKQTPKGIMQLALAIDAAREFLREQAAGLAPARPEIASNMAAARRAQGNVDGAIEAARTALQLAPDDPAVHHNLGNALKETGRIEEASQATDGEFELLRIVASGKANEVPITWIYFHLAATDGRRAALVFTLASDNIERFAKSDHELIGGFRFLKAEAAEQAARPEAEETR